MARQQPDRNPSSRDHRRQSGNPAVRAGAAAQPSPPPQARHPRLVTADEGVLPPDGVSYPQILRGASYAWWKSVLGVLFGLSVFLLMTATVSQVVIGAAWSFAGRPDSFESFFSRAVAFELPSGMLAVNLGIATLIPLSWLLMAIVHQVRPHWLSSVQPGIRWRYLLICLGVAFLALNGVLLLSTLVAPAPAWSVQPGFWGFLVVIILTSPIQAAAEEIFFRGYLMQALGSLVARPWFGVVVSSLLFALLHGGQNLPLFIDRLGFGLLAAVLVWRTGGIEAGIAAHVINNICAYVLAGLTTSIAEVRGIDSIGWADAAFDVGGFAVFAVLAYVVAARMRLRTTVQLAVTG